ncbi:hypothetical protein B0H13DRAFT_2387082 [Mycena leptocephala]|nr:hypothetical protein B0H13DRAFT_2387082 [Mycena leptocephala]
MAADNMPKGQMFHGIKYHICPGLPNTQQAELRSILNSDGASEVSEPKVATRIITDQAHFSAFQVPQYNAAIVTPQWVFASIDAGMKQPSRYYSADPAMFFTSMVVSVLGISPPHADLIRAIVIKYSGQWEATEA